MSQMQGDPVRGEVMFWEHHRCPDRGGRQLQLSGGGGGVRGAPGLLLALQRPRDRLPGQHWNECYPKVRKDFTITEKASTRAFSWLKVPTSAITLKTLLRHYAKQTLTPW